MRTIGDLLCLLPQRYEDRTAIAAIGALVPGEKALVEGTIELAEVAIRRRRSLLCRVADGTGAVTLRFFHFTRSQQDTLVRGARVRCYGEVRAGPTGLEMVHPETRALTAAEPAPDSTLTPIYPSTEGLHQALLRRLVGRALAVLERQPLVDYLGDLLDGRRGAGGTRSARSPAAADADAPALSAALELLHRPPQDAPTALLTTGRHPAQRRIALEELVAQRLSLRASADAIRSERSWPLPEPREALARLRGGLPFPLTRAQERAFAEILADLGRADADEPAAARRRRLGQDRGRGARCSRRGGRRQADRCDGADRAARRAARRELRALARRAQAAASRHCSARRARASVRRRSTRSPPAALPSRSARTRCSRKASRSIGSRS